jgi:hypothetical protein
MLLVILSFVLLPSHLLLLTSYLLLCLQVVHFMMPTTHV